MKRPSRSLRPAAGDIGAPARPQAGDLSRERVRFAEDLARKGLRLTRQRNLLLEEIFKGAGHFEAEELVARMLRRRVRVSRATVYRTLELLQECRLVEKVNFGTGRSFYEHVQLGAHHDHMICTRCGRVIEFFDERLESLQESICRRHDFRLTSHSMRLFGRCAPCLAQPD